MIFKMHGVEAELFDHGDRNVIHEVKGGYEPETLDAWIRAIHPGKAAIDVGAYTGLYSIFAVKCGAVVAAFEPMPENIWRFKVNTRHNKVHSDIHLFETAVSDFVGDATLNYNSRVPLTTGASLEVYDLHHDSRYKVKVLTIDAIGIVDVKVMKIDVERHEPSVIRGALTVIDRDKPELIIECLNEAMRDLVLSLLPGYEFVRTLDKRNVLLKPRL